MPLDILDINKLVGDELVTMAKEFVKAKIFSDVSRLIDAE